LNSITKAINAVLESRSLQSVIRHKDLLEFDITHPKLFIGEIASGDQFFCSNEQKQKLQSQLPNVLCVEMEGAAVTQVCYEYEIPCCIIRTISDTANDLAHQDFPSSYTKNIEQICIGNF
jgi:adenosylhomocysteine nucleosidase